MAPAVEATAAAPPATAPPPPPPPSAPIVGIIYPPTEVRNIVDKTAGFVARNGIKFEERIRENEKANPKFSFLNPTDPYHAYYQFKMKEISEGGGLKDEKKDDKPAAEQQQQKPPPPEPAPFDFMAEQPQVTAQDLDVLKLTAQFVARNGRAFLTGLSQREARNYQFDFLRQNHSLFPYFTRMVEQYTKVLIPPKSTIELLNEWSEDKFRILERVMQRVEWTEYENKQKKQTDATMEAERAAFNAIDWHNFVIVGAVDFKSEEDEIMLPPPITYESLVGRTLVQKKQAALLVMPEAPPPPTTEDAEMDIDMEKDEAAPVPAAPVTDEANMRIRRDYVPKATLADQVKRDEQKFVFRGQEVAASSVAQHLRVELLDPKWKEQREASMQKTKETNLAPDSDISKHLSTFARRRTDIFGREETEIGRKIGEDEEQLKQLQQMREESAWDGNAGSIPTARLSAQQVSMLPTPTSVEPPRAVGPQVTGYVPPVPTYSYPPPLPIPNPVVVPPPPVFMPQAPMMPYGYGAPVPTFMGAQYPGMMVPPPPPPEEEDNPAKRHRGDDAGLIPEDAFLAMQPSAITVRIGVPQQEAKGEQWRLNGQVEPIDVSLTQTVGQLKELLQQRVGLPSGKMNIRHTTLGFLKDQHTLAFYNIVNNADLQMLLRERGGRKK